ncbi:MAG: DNA repair protein RecO [Bacteroidetes bacterium]|nr:DNA repair protein RecO [Bacteroidota bacterium]
MLQKTGGIVFRYIRFKETSIITTILTQFYGIQSFIVNGVRSKKPKFSIALFQPLTLLEMVVYHKETSNLQRISEVRCANQYRSIPYNFKKSGIALFLSEMLYKVIRHESHPKEVFEFITTSLLSLDSLDEQFENFHLQFLLKLTRYLGFYPQTATELEEQLLHGDTILGKEIDFLLNNGYSDYITITNEQRRALLENIIDFYRIHIEGIGKIHSYKILHEVIRH